MPVANRPEAEVEGLAVHRRGSAFDPEPTSDQAIQDGPESPTVIRADCIEDSGLHLAQSVGERVPEPRVLLL